MRGVFVGICCLVFAATTTSCGGKATALERAAAGVAKTQGVDESSVLKALRSVARSEDEQLALAKSWETNLPKSHLPDLTIAAKRFETFADKAQQELRSAACAAVIDIIQTRRVPSKEVFVRDYLQGLVVNLTQSQLLEVAQTFENVWLDARRGDTSGVEARLTIMRYQYCDNL